jgi:glycosyltransferase involved in cell wall biosynthesis
MIARAKESRARLDVIIPARDEPAAGLARCLDRLLADGAALDLAVIVVANGPAHAAVAAATDRYVRGFAGALRVVTTPVSGKANALNVGDRHRRGGAVVYLDADVVLLPGTLLALADALQGRSPRFAAPRRRLAPARGCLTRAYARVWESLPGVAADVGSGCYGVNAAGRDRWGSFPNLLADDAFVRTRFAADECVIAGPGAVVRMPEGVDLVRAVRRWRTGNAQLRTAAGSSADVGGGLVRNLAHLAARPGLWADLSAFAAITAAALLAPAPQDGAWRPARRSAGRRRRTETR